MLLEDQLLRAPILALPDFSLPFELETDDCQTGIGAVLMQKGRPIAYFIEALCPRNQALSTYEKEILAIMTAVGKWSGYLIGAKFVIIIDHASLRFLREQKITNSLRQKWLYKLMGYDFSIVQTR